MCKNIKKMSCMNSIMINCDHCGKIFRYNCHLLRHLSSKTPCYSKTPPVFVDIDNDNKDKKEENEDKAVDSDNRKKHQCSKCSKRFFNKKDWKSHEAKCNGLHKLQCPTCLKFFNDSSYKSKHIKNVKCKPPTNENDVYEPHKHSVYLLIEREFLTLKKNVFKIGRSENVINRAKQYPNGSRLLITLPCVDGIASEKHLKYVFKKNFVHRTDIGSEYFEGTPDVVIQLFLKNVEARF